MKCRWKHTIVSRQDEELKKQKPLAALASIRIWVSIQCIYFSVQRQVAKADLEEEQSEIQNRIILQVCWGLFYVKTSPFSRTFYTLSSKAQNILSRTFSFFSHLSPSPQSSLQLQRSLPTFVFVSPTMAFHFLLLANRKLKYLTPYLLMH